MSIVADPHLSASHPILFCGHVYLKLLCNPDNVIRKISRNWPSFLAIAWLTVTWPHYRSPILSPSISACLCPIPIHSPLDEYNCFTCGSGWLAGWQPTRRDLCPLNANQSICLKFNGISHSMPPTTSFASLLAMTEAFGVDPPACCVLLLLLLHLWPPTIRDNFRPINVESTQSKTRITRLIDYIWEYPQIRSLIRQLICGWWAS